MIYSLKSSWFKSYLSFWIAEKFQKIKVSPAYFSVFTVYEKRIKNAHRMNPIEFEKFPGKIRFPEKSGFFPDFQEKFL